VCEKKQIGKRKSRDRSRNRNWSMFRKSQISARSGAGIGDGKGT
jgi:hypothetical protein